MLEPIERMKALITVSPSPMRWLLPVRRGGRLVGVRLGRRAPRAAVGGSARHPTVSSHCVPACDLPHRYRRRPPSTALTIALPMLEATERIMDLAKVSP